MRYSSIVNHKRKAVSAIDSMFSCAEILGMPADEIVTAYQKILADHPKLPRYVREYLQGRFDVLWSDLYRAKLVFGGYFDGVFYSTHSNRPDYYAKHGIDPAQWAKDTHSGVIKVTHYWITTRKPMPFGKES
jgi:hypothetical protein